MARGDHPMRTPFYGALLIVSAMVGGTLVWTAHPSTWVKAVVLVLCLVAWLVGLAMTLRDLTPTRSEYLARRRR